MKTHEEEVTIRLKFENKLNDLHSLHSNLKIQYERALQELGEQEKVSKDTAEIMLKLEQGLIKYKTESLQKEK